MPIRTMISTQHSLVGRLREKVSDADLTRFYDLYSGPILAFAASFSLKEEDCRDVLQETMIVMVRRGFSAFDPEKGRFTTWLFRIARGRVIDALRKRQRAAGTVSLDDDPGFAERLADPASGPVEIAERNAEMMLIQRVIAFLLQEKFFKPETIEIFKAVAIEQRAPEEVAATFGSKRGSVDQAKYAVLKKLRSVLAAMDRGLSLEEAAEV